MYPWALPRRLDFKEAFTPLVEKSNKCWNSPADDQTFNNAPGASSTPSITRYFDQMIPCDFLKYCVPLSTRDCRDMIR